MMKITYKSSVFVLWIVGTFISIEIARSLVLDQARINYMRIGVIVGLLACSYITAFSFFWGAQRGHWFRALNVFLFLCLSFAIYRSYIQTASYMSSMSIAGMGMFFTALNLRMTEKFRKDYARYGTVDYFDRYFLAVKP